ncbi:(S)-benzoin forming benzil reductase [soil metagenome]
MNYYFITGSSRGIGKALSEILLEDSRNMVCGLARSTSIQHERYKHYKADLSDLKQLTEILDDFFTIEQQPEQIILINNAGFLGEVGPLGKISNESLITVFNINIIAPAMLMNSFINKFKETEAEKIIINITSGAAQRAVAGWSGYCSSKAALNMISEVAENEADIHSNGTKIYALAPGVVDTEMQSEIRKVHKKDFDEVDRFINMYESGDLSDPEKTASQILYFIKNYRKFSHVIQDVRKF